MNACEAFSDKIIFFDDLSRDEQQKVVDHIDECAHCQKDREVVQRIMSSLETGQVQSHIEDDLLVRYGLYLADPEEPDYDGRRLTIDEIRNVQKHVDDCDQCHRRVDQIRKEYDEINDYLEEAEFPQISIVPRPSKLAAASGFAKSVLESIKDAISVPIPRFYPVAIGAMAVVFLIIWVGPLFRGSDNPYFELAALKRDQISLVTRSGGAAQFTDGLNAFQEGNYQSAIEHFQQFVDERPGDPLLYYAHYILGLAYLLDAKSDFWGRFQKFDPAKAEQGVEHLRTAQSLTDNLGIREDCLWYIAKAYLMRGDTESAKSSLEEVVNLRGRRFRDAEEMIKKLDSLPNSP